MYKLYIAGKITGDPYYVDKFCKAEIALHNVGYTVLTPAILPEGMRPIDYMRICLAMLETADGVALLDDWQSSAGAQIEKSTADYIGRPTKLVRQWIDMMEERKDE